MRRNIKCISRSHLCLEQFFGRNIHRLACCRCKAYTIAELLAGSISRCLLLKYILPQGSGTVSSHIRSYPRDGSITHCACFLFRLQISATFPSGSAAAILISDKNLLLQQLLSHTLIYSPSLVASWFESISVHTRRMVELILVIIFCQSLICILSFLSMGIH